MKDKEPISNDEIQKSTRQDEPRILPFLKIQSTVEYIGILVYKLVDWFTRRGCFLKLEVKGSADGWALVLSFELR